MSKHGVCRVMIHNQGGVSLLETMIGLFTLLMIVSLFPSIFLNFINSSPNVNEFSYEEYVLFTNQFQMEFKKSDMYWISERNNKIFFERPEDGYVVHFEQYQDKIRRQVRGLGHDVFMQNVSNFKVIEREYGIDINVITDNGVLQKSIVHPGSFHENIIRLEEGER
ncbi:competence type IV pilus minor pilin ComGF [Salipaludibacillus sp. HK11]|uniref:competence type IV pilus minor pilin ComGF n=1 Tax=Salipaludibacillus sp. HK11 TaxID=3394320 RepID=UPI0039FC686C